MSNSLPGLQLVLSADIARFTAGMDDAAAAATKAVGSIQRQFEELKSSFEGIAAGLAFEKIVEEAGNAEDTLAQLNATLASTHDACGMTSEALQEMAEALSKHSTATVESIEQGEGMLAMFSNLKGVMPQATQAAVDMAARLHQDVPQAAMALGRALQDPIKGMQSLRREGVTFTDSQKELIKQFMAVGDVADAQQVILKQVEQQYGGAAEAARGTLGGALKELGNSFNELLKNIGESQSSGLNQALNGMIDLMDSASAHAQQISDVLLGLGAGAGVLALAKMPEYIEAISASLVKAGLAVDTFEAQATLGLSVVVAGLVMCKDNAVTFGDQTTTVGDLAVAAFNRIGDSVKNIANTALYGYQNIGAGIQLLWQTVSDFFTQRINLMASDAQFVFNQILNGMKAIAEQISKIPMFSGVKQQADDAAKSITQAMQNASSSWQQAQQNMSKTAGNMWNATGVPQLGNDIAKNAIGMTALRANQTAKHLMGGGPAPGDDSLGATGASQKAAQAAQKHSDEFSKFIEQQDAQNGMLAAQVTGNQDMANILKQRADLESRIGTLTASEATQLQHVLEIQRNLNVSKQLQSADQGVQDQLANVQAELNGQKALLPILQQVNNLKKQGIDYAKQSPDNQARINQLMADSLQLAQSQAGLQTKNMIDGLQEEIIKRQNIILYGQQQADNMEQLAKIQKDNPWITADQLDRIKQMYALEQQMANADAGQKFLQNLQRTTQEQAAQLQNDILKDQHLSNQENYQKQILDYEKQTKSVADDQVKSLIQQEMQQQQLITDAKNALTLIESQRTEQQKQADQIQQINQYWNEGLLTVDQWKTAMMNVDPQLKTMSDMAKTIGQDFSNAFSSMITGGQSFGQVLTNLGKQLADLVAKKALFDPLATAITNGLQNMVKGLFSPPTGTGAGQGSNQFGGLLGGMLNGLLPKSVQNFAGGFLALFNKNTPNAPKLGAPGLGNNPLRGVNNPLGSLFGGGKGGSNPLGSLFGNGGQSVTNMMVTNLYVQNWQPWPGGTSFGGGTFPGSPGGITGGLPSYNPFTASNSTLYGKGGAPGGITVPTGASGLLSGLGSIGNLFSGVMKLFGIKGFAAGGTVAPGQPAIVGENGPELWLPGSGGSVLSNQILQAFSDPNSDVTAALFAFPGMGGGMPSMPRMPSGPSFSAGASMAAPSYQAQANALAGILRSRESAMQAMPGGWGGEMASGNEIAAKQWISYGAQNPNGNPWAGTPQIFQTPGTWNQMLHNGNMNGFVDPAFMQWAMMASGGQQQIPALNIGPIFSGGGDDGSSTPTPTPAPYVPGPNTTPYNANGIGGNGIANYAPSPSIPSPTPNPPGSPYASPSIPSIPTPSGLSQYQQFGNYPLRNPGESTSDYLARIGSVINSGLGTTGGPPIGGPSDLYSPAMTNQELGFKDLVPETDDNISWMPGFANGGDPPVGQPAIVGEDGPELIVPKAASTVIPNSVAQALGSGGPNVEIHNYSGHPVSTDMAPDGKTLRVMVGQMMQTELKNGSFKKTLENQYNLKPKGVAR